MENKNEECKKLKDDLRAKDEMISLKEALLSSKDTEISELKEDNKKLTVEVKELKQQ